eukprot:scaffold124062_cov28-Tisochrysis_lutea.AAC.1
MRKCGFLEDLAPLDFSCDASDRARSSSLRSQKAVVSQVHLRRMCSVMRVAPPQNVAPQLLLLHCTRGVFWCLSPSSVTVFHTFPTPDAGGWLYGRLSRLCRIRDVSE